MVVNVSPVKAAPIAAGVVFGLACILFLDGIVVANRESDPRHRFSFTMCVPALFSVIGLLLFILVSPDDIREDKRRHKAVLFFAWIAMFGSTVAALVIVFFCFTGKQTRERAYPGVEFALFTIMTPLTGSIIWKGRATTAEDEDW